MADERSGRSVGRGILALISGAMLAQLFTLAMIPILSRLYGPTQFGEYAIFVSVVTLAAILGTARYEMAIVLPRSGREAAAVVKIGVRLLGATSLILTVLGWTVAAFLDEPLASWKWLLLLLGPSVFILGYMSFMTQWFTREGKYVLISRNRVALSVISGLAQLALGLLLTQSGIGLILGFLLGQVASAILLSFSNRAAARIFSAARTRRWTYLFRKYRRLPSLLMPHTLIDSFRLNGVNLLIGQYSVAALGQYSQAWRLVQVPAGLIGSAISQVYFPRLASIPRPELFATARGAVLRSLALGLIPFAFIFFLSPSLFPIILGAEWVDAGRYAQALVPALYVNLAASPISTIFIVLRKEHVGLIFSLVYTVTSLAALFIFSRDLLLAIWIMSIVQAISLVAYIALALWLARRAGAPTRLS